MGLREQKKAQSRSAMASAAADLFGRQGFANVAMAQVAAAAGVSDQTLYNYFPTKESLVFDRWADFEELLLTTVLRRPTGVGVVDAYAQLLDGFVLGLSAQRSVNSPGGMPRLVASSDPLRRALLDLTHNVAGVLAARLVEQESLSSALATVLTDALLAVMVRTTQRLGEVADASELPAVAAEATAMLDAIRPILDPPHRRSATARS